MWQLVFAKVSVQRWVIGTDVHGLLNVSGCALCLLVNNAEAIGADWMSCGAGMKVIWGGGLEMLLESVPKKSASLSYVLNWTVDGWAFVLVNNSTFL